MKWNVAIVLAALLAGPAAAQMLVYPPDVRPGPTVLGPMQAGTTNVTNDRIVDQLVDFNQLVTSPLGSPVVPGASASVVVEPDGSVILPQIDSGIAPADSPLITFDGSFTVGTPLAEVRPGGSVTAAMPLPDVRIIDQIVPRNLSATAAAQAAAGASAGGISAGAGAGAATAASVVLPQGIGNAGTPVFGSPFTPTPNNPPLGWVAWPPDGPRP